MTLKRLAANAKVRAIALVVAGVILGVGGTVAVAHSQPSKYEKLPACVNEDGNRDGKPCWWTDPDTGIRYYVTSENYL